jgi:hypothetical protein
VHWRIDELLVLLEAIADISPETVAVGVMDNEVHEVLDEVETIRVWLDRYVAALLERKAKPEPAPATPSEMVH